MSGEGCDRCGRRLMRDFAYCPACGTPVPGGSASFVFESADDEANEQLFTKPAAESSMGWRPIAGALVALLAVVAIMVAISGTGRDVALAPTPVPTPDPTAAPERDAAITEDEGEDTETADEGEDTETAGGGERTEDGRMPPGDGVFGLAASRHTTELLEGLPENLPRITAGSEVNAYSSVLVKLARAYKVEGTVVFGTADHAVRLDLETGHQTSIALEGQEFQLGGKSGIVTKAPGELPTAKRWDGWVTTVDIVGGADGFFDTWRDPNGWELVQFHNDNGVGVLAPWALASDGSNPSMMLRESITFPPPIELFTEDPKMWTWDGGTHPSPWTKVLARNQNHLLVESCGFGGACRRLVVDGGNNTLANVADSLILDTESHLLILSSHASVLRVTVDGLSLESDRDGTHAAVTGSDLTAELEIVNLETASVQSLPDIDFASVAQIPYWIGDALIVVPLRLEPDDTQEASGLIGQQADIIFNRAGIPVGVLEWEYPLNNRTAAPLSYFAPDF